MIRTQKVISAPEDNGDPIREELEEIRKPNEFHSKVLMGYYAVTPQSPTEIRNLVEDDTILWIVQNPWSGFMPVMLITTEYVSHSAGSFIFFEKNGRTPKEVSTVETNPAPITESSIAGLPDNASWPRSSTRISEIAGPENK